MSSRFLLILPQPNQAQKSSVSHRVRVSHLIIKQGELTKKGAFVKNWKDRYWILTTDSLAYFKSPDVLTSSLSLSLSFPHSSLLPPSLIPLPSFPLSSFLFIPVHSCSLFIPLHSSFLFPSFLFIPLPPLPSLFLFPPSSSPYPSTLLPFPFLFPSFLFPLPFHPSLLLSLPPTPLFLFLSPSPFPAPSLLLLPSLFPLPSS